MATEYPNPYGFYPYRDIVCKECGKIFLLKNNDPIPYRLGMLCPYCQYRNTPREIMAQIRATEFQEGQES